MTAYPSPVAGYLLLAVIDAAAGVIAWCGPVPPRWCWC
jgi:hypothetical protein